MLKTNDQWQVGRVRVTRLVDLESPAPGEMLLPDATTEAVLSVREVLGPHATDDGWLTFAVNAFIVEDGDQVTLVDAGIGSDKPRPSPFFDHLDAPLLAQLEASGVTPDDVGVVVATHLHPDHVGWLTRLVDGRWRPTFANARHLVPSKELDHWSSGVHIDRDGAYFDDSVRPVVDAGLVEPVAGDARISPCVSLLPTPGHSPGHVSVRIESGTASAVITGDVIHHPVQCLRPEWTCIFDEDPVRAAQTRRSLLTELADTDTLVIGTHFAPPTVGRVVTADDTWRLLP